MIRRDFLSEVSRMTSNMYAALLDAKTVEERAAEYARTFGVTPELANCYFTEQAAKKELQKQITK